MPKYKLPIIKPTIKKIERKGPLTLYDKNKRKLSFIPTAFITFTCISLVFLFVWYFNIFGFAEALDRVSSTETRTQEPEEMVAGARDKTESSFALSDVESSKGDSLLIVGNSGQNCELKFTFNTPSQVEPKIEKSQQGWWVPSSCGDVLAIQIIRVQEKEIEDVLQSSDYQKLDNKRPYTYAILYYNSDKFDYDLSRYAQSLAANIFSDRTYFDAAFSWETKVVGSNVYYLTEGCQGGGSDDCTLWVLSKETGQSFMGYKDLALEQRDSKGVLSSNYSVKFAKTQDFSSGINIIIIYEKKNKIKLVRYNVSTAQIDSYEDYELGDYGYEAYYR